MVDTHFRVNICSERCRGRLHFQMETLPREVVLVVFGFLHGHEGVLRCVCQEWKALVDRVWETLISEGCSDALVRWAWDGGCRIPHVVHRMAAVLTAKEILGAGAGFENLLVAATEHGRDFVCEVAVYERAVLRERIQIAAAKHNRWSILKYYTGSIYHVDLIRLIEHALHAGHYECARELYTHNAVKMHCGRSTLIAAFQTLDLETIKFFVLHFVGDRTHIMKYAAMTTLEIVLYVLDETGLVWFPDYCFIAAAWGRLDIIEHFAELIKEMCIGDIVAMHAMADGHIAVLEFMIREGCVPAFAMALVYNRLDVLQVMPNIDPAAAMVAGVDTSSLEIVQWVYETYGVPLPGNAASEAILQDAASLLEYILEHSEPQSTAALLLEAEHHNATRCHMLLLPVGEAVSMRVLCECFNRGYTDLIRSEISRRKLPISPQMIQLACMHDDFSLFKFMCDRCRPHRDTSTTVLVYAKDPRFMRLVIRHNYPLNTERLDKMYVRVGDFSPPVRRYLDRHGWTLQRLTVR
jgi:hypothetical protein